MPTKLKSTGVEFPDGTTQTSVNVPTSAMPAGSVIQVKHVVTRVNAETSSPDVIFDLGLSISITPRDVNSKFLLFAKINARTDDSGYSLIWFRNGSAVRTPAQDFERFSTATSHNPGHHQYFDEPATTSTITYEAKPKTYIQTGDVKFNDNGAFDSNLTVMEIAG